MKKTVFASKFKSIDKNKCSKSFLNKFKWQCDYIAFLSGKE